MDIIILILLIIAILIILFSLLGTLGNHYNCKNNRCKWNFFPGGDFSSKKDCEEKCTNEDYNKEIIDLHIENKQIKSELQKLKNEKFDFEKLSEELLQKYEENRNSRKEYSRNRYYKTRIELKDNSWFTLCLPTEKREDGKEYIPFTNQMANNMNSYATFDECARANNYIKQPYRNLTRLYNQNFWTDYLAYPNSYSCAFGNCRGRFCTGCNNYHHRRHKHHDRHHNQNNKHDNTNNTVNNNIKIPIIAYESGSSSNSSDDNFRVKHIIAPPNKDISNKFQKSIEKIQHKSTSSNTEPIEPAQNIELDLSKDIPPPPQDMDMQMQPPPQDMDMQIPPPPQDMDMQMPPPPQDMDMQMPPPPQDIDMQIPPPPQDIDMQMPPPPQDLDMQMPPPPQDLDIQMPPPPPQDLDIQISEDFKMPSKYTDLTKESYQKINTTNNIPTDNFQQPHEIISENKQEVPIGVFGYSKHRNKSKNNTHVYGVS